MHMAPGQACTPCKSSSAWRQKTQRDLGSPEPAAPRARRCWASPGGLPTTRPKHLAAEEQQRVSTGGRTNTVIRHVAFFFPSALWDCTHLLWTWLCPPAGRCWCWFWGWVLLGRGWRPSSWRLSSLLLTGSHTVGPQCAGVEETKRSRTYLHIFKLELDCQPKSQF